MLRSNSKSLGNHAVSSEEEKERLRWERFAEKEGGNWIYSVPADFSATVAHTRGILSGEEVECPSTISHE